MSANATTKCLVGTLTVFWLSAAMIESSSGQQATTGQQESQAIEDHAPDKVVWEYKVPGLIYNSSRLEADLNNLGAEGWELVHIQDGLPAVFKRQKRANADDDATNPSDAFVGVWYTHYQQTFIKLIIQPNHKAVFVLLDQGHSFDEVPWFSADNGIIVGGYPMLRLWKADQPDRCKARMQAVPPEATNDTFVRFPLNFYMTRQKRRPQPATPAELTVPTDWLAAEPPADFDDLVGKPREVTSK